MNEVMGEECLKMFILNCRKDSPRSFSFCQKTMAAFFYLLNEQISLDDQVFFTAVELFNKYLICSMTSRIRSSNLREESQLFKEKCRTEKYLLATGCFHLAAQICHRSIDSIRLIELNPNNFTREDLLEIEMEILTGIRYQFPRHTPHLFISYFLRYLNEQQKIHTEHLYKASMLLLVHIYLQWRSLVELLTKKENGSTTVNQQQMESVNQRLRDPLLVGSATILAASKMFSHGTNSHLHDKIVHLCVSLLGIDPMRIYIAQFFAEEVLQKSVQGRPFPGVNDHATSKILIDREHDFDDESIVTFSSP